MATDTRNHPATREVSTELLDFLLDSEMLGGSVEIDADRRAGVPVLRGTRFKVSQVLAQIAAGDSVEDLAGELELDEQLVKQFLRELAMALDQACIR